ncbi:MAG: hypothetical protein ACOVQ2_08975 [Flavobacterium sp.]
MKKLIYILFFLTIHLQSYCNSIDLFIKDNTIVKGVEHLVCKQTKNDTVYVLKNTILFSKENFSIKLINIDGTKLKNKIIVSKKNIKKDITQKINKNFVSSKSHYLGSTSSFKNLIASSYTFPSFFINNSFTFNVKKTLDMVAQYMGSYIIHGIKNIFFVNFYNKPPPHFF